MTMPDYSEKIPVGADVQIMDRAILEAFRLNWAFHNPLSVEQLDWAGRRAVVAPVGFYHGGDPLYQLRGVPGVWHETCLTDITVGAT
jgi:hypothetical protein